MDMGICMARDVTKSKVGADNGKYAARHSTNPTNHPDLHTCMYVQARPVGLPILALGQGTSARPVITRRLEGAHWIPCKPIENCQALRQLQPPLQGSRKAIET